MSLVLSGPALGVLTREGTDKNGRPYKMRRVSVQHGLGSLFVTLADDIPDPGEGEIVAYEVSAKVLPPREGNATDKAQIVWNAHRAVALPGLGKVA